MADKAVIGIVGAGTMGAGIAQVAAQSGHPVVLYDIKPEFVERGFGTIRKSLQGRVDKGKLAAAALDPILDRITPATEREALAPARFVIEAVPENLALKQELFAALDQICSPEAILASNTSSLSITALGAATEWAERVVGMHFFNPAPAMALVEVIAGQRTHPAATAAVVDLARALGKTPVQARDTPGFIVNRVARPFYGEALRLLGEQILPVDEIDRLIQLAGFRMGPFALMDLIGIDINFAVTESVYAAFFGEPRYRPHPIQRRLVESGMIGRKAGRGFYSYDGPTPQPNPQLAIDPTYRALLAQGRLPADLERALAAQLQQAGAAAAIGTEPLAPYVVGRVVCGIINEAAFALGEGVATAADIDTAMTLGVNYPHGPLAWARQLGLPLVVQVLDHLYAFYHEERYRVAPLLRQLSAPGGEGSHDPW
ncbi:MAG TPA: 3-hydroxyacyl-CoA dehydrogenase NAD-binding domain-containing protein [Chloroflexia bacterium]|nr:3-hydroxyacyl-CoA dehydrogenase NAD-binding domain-containing protein [Chloroflexia bacterium]